MLKQIRQHQKEIEMALEDFTVKEDQWQLWSDYHQRQMLMFQNQELIYVLNSMFLFLFSLIGIGMSISLANVWLLGLSLLLALSGIATFWYLWLYHQSLRECMALTTVLHEHALAMTTKPLATVWHHVLETASKFLSKKFEQR